MKNDHSWRGMIIKDNEGDWGICVATWRGMTKGKPGVPGMLYQISNEKSEKKFMTSQKSRFINAIVPLNIKYFIESL